MVNPVLSIIVPVYNVEKYLSSCVESILSQTFSDYELILVNDGSTDKCGEICDGFSKKDHRVKVIHKENGGVSSARNLGIESAVGQYIGFVDPDDMIEPNMYKIMYEVSRDKNPDIVVCQIRTIDLKNSRSTISNIWSETNCVIDRIKIQEKIIPSVLTKGSYSLLSCVNKLYKRTCFSDLRFDEKKTHGEDARFNLLLLTKVKSILFLDTALYNYFLRYNSSLTHIFHEDLYDNIVDSKNFGLYLCERYKMQKEMKNYIQSYLVLSFNYMQDVVTSPLVLTKKYELLLKIMSDIDFKRHVKEFKCPSFFYKVLKITSIRKLAWLFIFIVKIKIKIQESIKRDRYYENKQLN